MTSHPYPDRQAPRTWDAVLVAEGVEIDVPPTWDTLREIVQAGLRAAKDLDVEDATLVVYKTTKARGRERDRSFAIERDARRRYRASDPSHRYYARFIGR